MYKLQWANMYKKNGKPVNPIRYKYQDTIFIFENKEDAETTRVDLLRDECGVDAKYIKVVEVN